MQNQQLTEDLRFLRSMIDRTRPRIDAAAPIMITWGSIALIGSPLTEWLIRNHRFDDIDRVWAVLIMLIGVPLSAYFGYRAKKQCALLGVTPYVARQIGWVWAVLIPNLVAWSFLVRFWLHAPHLMVFVSAAIYGIGLAMMGILYSKEWMIAGLSVFIAIPTAAFYLEHAQTVLGMVIGISCIVPALISLRRQSEDRKAVHA